MLRVQPELSDTEKPSFQGLAPSLRSLSRNGPLSFSHRGNNSESSQVREFGLQSRGSRVESDRKRVARGGANLPQGPYYAQPESPHGQIVVDALHAIRYSML